MLVVLLAYQLWLSYSDQVRAAETNARNLAAIFETRLEATLPYRCGSKGAGRGYPDGGLKSESGSGLHK